MPEESNLTWVERYGFKFVPPAETLRAGFKVINTELGCSTTGQVAMKVTTFPDLDGASTTVNRYVYVDKQAPNSGDYVISHLQSFKANLAIQEQLDPKVKERMAEALKAGWPTLFATRLAYTGKTIEALSPPPKVLLNIEGRVGAGKSTLVAALAWRFNMPVFSFDQFSPMSPTLYTDFFARQNLSRIASSQDILKAVVQCRKIHQKDKSTVKLAKPLGTLLDEQINQLSKTPSNSPFIVAEAVTTGENSGRDANIYDLATTAAEGDLVIGFPSIDYNLNETETAVLAFASDEKNHQPLSRPQLGLFYRPDYSNREDPWAMRADVLESTLDQFEKLKPQLLQMAINTRNEFAQAIKDH